MWLWSGGEHIVIESIRWRSSGTHFDPELPVGVHWGTLGSSAYGGGPAGNALTLTLLFKSVGKHCDLTLAVQVRRNHFDPELAGQFHPSMPYEKTCCQKINETVRQRVCLLILILDTLCLVAASVRTHSFRDFMSCEASDPKLES